MYELCRRLSPLADSLPPIGVRTTLWALATLKVRELAASADGRATWLQRASELFEKPTTHHQLQQKQQLGINAQNQPLQTVGGSSTSLVRGSSTSSHVSRPKMTSLAMNSRPFSDAAGREDLIDGDEERGRSGDAAEDGDEEEVDAMRRASGGGATHFVLRRGRGRGRRGAMAGGTRR